jgi:hypothetical protein
MDRYPNISDHGLTGDLQTAALVSTDGTVDSTMGPERGAGARPGTGCHGVLTRSAVQVLVGQSG